MRVAPAVHQASHTQDCVAVGLVGFALLLLLICIFVIVRAERRL
jgi:hypothetical protein